MFDSTNVAYGIKFTCFAGFKLTEEFTDPFVCMMPLSCGNSVMVIVNHICDHNNNSYTFNKLIDDLNYLLYQIHALLQTTYCIHNAHQVDPQFSCHCG